MRKIRFSFRTLAIVLCFVSAAAAMMVLITGDYTRAQLARAKNYVFLRQVSDERNNLRSKNLLLESQVKEFKTTKDETASYEDRIKRRLKELSSVIDSATSLGLGDTSKRSRDRSARGGQGGAEIDCEKGDRCNDLIEEAKYQGEDPLGALNNASQDDLLKLLDAYISVLRTLPLGYPASGDVTSGFGFRVSPFGRSRIKMHEGVDLALKYGTYIYATGDGIVKTIRSNATYGNMVDIQHGDRLSSRYAHLSRILLKDGQRVRRGDIVGLAGSTGRSTGPHLHYEVLVDGRPKNPSRFIDLAKRLDKLF